MAHRKRLTSAERRAQLIEVGRKVFAEHGFEGTSVEEIARVAQVSKPIIYEHFGGKEGLFAVIVDREMETLHRQVTASIAAGTARERLEQAIVAFLAYIMERPDGFAVLTRDAPATFSSGGMKSVISGLGSRVRALFEDMFAEAGYDPAAAPIYAHALIGMVTLTGQWWQETQEQSVEFVARHLAAIGWMGLRHLPKDPQLIE